MTTSQIGIKLSLDGAATVTSGLGAVQNSLGSLAGRVETVRSALAGFAPALASAFTVGGLVAFVRNTTNAIDAMNDLADATGSTIEEISKLDQVARRNGASLDAVGGMLVKFNAQLKEADGKNGVSIALQAIGLEAAKLRQLDPSEALRQTAVALAEFADDGNKARIVQELFGKSVREAAPFLKDLAEAGQLNASVTAQQAAEAEKFNKQLFAFQANASEAARAIVGDLLPVISEVLKGFDSGADGVGRFSTAIDAVRVPIEALAVFGANVAFVFKGVGRELGAIAAQLTVLAQGDLVGFRAISEAVREDAKRAREELEAYEKRVLNARELARESAVETWGSEGRRVRTSGRPLIDIAAEQARRKAAEESAAALLKQQEAYDKLRVSIEERISAGQLELTQGQALTEAQRIKIKLDQDYASGLLKLTPAQKAVLDGKVADLAATEAQVKAEQEALKAAKAAAEARADARRAEERAIAEFQAAETARASAALASVKDRITSLQDEAKAAELVANLNISLAEALELVTIARLEEKQAQYQEGSEPYLAVQREIEARKQLASLMGDSAVREANRRAAEDAAREWQRTADQIGQSLSDALMQGGKSAWEYIKGLFRTMVLRPVIQAIVNPVVGAFGGGMGGPAGAMNTLGGINSLATLGSAITGSFTSSIANVIGTAGTMFGSSALTAFSAGMKGATLAPGLMGPTTAGAGGAMGAGASVAAAVPYVAAALAVANALGVFRSRSIVGGGLTGTLGMGDIQSYDLQRRGGTLFSGPDYSLVNRQVSAESAAIQGAFQALRTNAASMAEALGLSSTAVKTFTTTLGTDIVQNDIGVRGIKLDGLTAEQAAKKVEEALAAANEELAAFVLGASRTVTESITTTVEDWAEGEQGGYLRGYLDQVSEVTRTIEATGPSFARTGETAVQTLTRLASSISTINPVLDLLGLQLFDTSLAGADLASTMADAFGGLEAFTAATSTYYQEFFSEAERTAAVTAQLTETLGSLGLALPDTREAFRALVEAQDLTTESGRAAFATLVSLSGTFAALVPQVEAVDEAATGATQALRSAADILRERQGLERELLQLQGDTTALRALDRAALDESNRALFDRITALQDSQAAEAAAAEATRTAAAEAAEAARAAQAEAQRITQERLGLERQLLNLQGDTAAIRALERAALDESNRALFDRITALQDSQAATEAAAQAEATLASERERVAQERAGLNRQLLELQGDTAAIRALERAALDESNRALFDQITALQDSKAAAEAAAQAQRDYTAAVQTAQAAVQRAREAVASAQSGVDAVRAEATSAYLAAQERVAQATQRIADLNNDLANRAREAALQMRELGDSLQSFVRGQTTSPQAQFAQTLREALGGDQAAMRNLPQAAEAAIEAARLSASTAAQAAIERARILSSVSEVAARAAATAVPDAPAAADPMAEATAALVTAQQSLSAALSVATQIGAPLSRTVEDLVSRYATAQQDLTKAVADLATAQAALAAIQVNTGNTVTAIADLDTALRSAQNTLDVQLKAVAESDLPEDIKTLIADAGKEYLITIDSVMKSSVSDAEKTLLLESVTTATRIVGLSMGSNNLSDEVRALIANEGKEYLITINGVLKASLSTAEKALLLESATTASRAVILGAAFSNVLSADEKKALNMVDETVRKTIEAAISSGTLTADQKTLLAQADETVSKTVTALVNTNSLTTDQRNFLALVTGSTSSTVTITGAVTFDPGNALQSIFNNISKSNALLAKLALSQINPATSTPSQKATVYSGFREVYTDAETRKIVETLFGPQTNSDWAALKSLAGFALGGVFTNGIVTQPTMFNMAQMGEAGPEAIMPLSRGADGSLGVRMFSDAQRRDEALVAEIRALRSEVAYLRAEARATAENTGKTQRLMQRVTRDGESMAVTDVTPA